MLGLTNLRLNLLNARRLEKEALGQAPQPLLKHRGEERFRAALQADPLYRAMLLAALLLAAAAGTGFGRLFLRSDALSATLWCGVALSLAMVCVAPRSIRGLLPALVAVCLAATFGWAWLCWVGVRDDDLPRQVLTVLRVLVVSAVLFMVATRYSFPAIAAAVIVLHVAANAWRIPDLHAVLWLQLTSVMLEFALMTGAAYRYTLATMLRLPRTTYRIAPLCVVPRLDRDLDHPIQINVV